MSFLNKVLSNVSPPDRARETAPPASAAFVKNAAAFPATAANQNDSILKSLAKNAAASQPDEQPPLDSRQIFRQEIERAGEQKLSRTVDRSVRVRFSKPAKEMSYDDYTRDYLRAMLREQGVSKATDQEINRFQALLKEVTGGDGFGVEDKAEQAKAVARDRAAQSKNGNEAYWGTSPLARAQVLAGAGAIIRERAAAGARLGEQQAVGQARATEMAADAFLKIPANVAIRTANGIKNTAIDVFTQQSPVVPQVVRELAKERTDLARVELKSEMMNRDASGKVTSDPNAVTAGKTIEVALEVAAPLVIGAATKPMAAPQGLGLGGTAQTTEVLMFEADAMAKAGSGSGRTIIGRRAKAEEITAVAQELGKDNIQIVKNADALIDKINPKAAAVFDFDKGRMLLRKDATFLEVFHEKTHAKQWAKLGKEEYLKLGRMAREEHVYKTIVENKHLFSERELNLSKSVIEEYRRRKSAGKID